jgi:D-aminopeptidase
VATTTPTGGVATNIIINTVEDTRFPLSSIIVSPSSFVASFDTSGNLVLSGYHYKVGHANHMFDYKAIGNINKIVT